MQFHKNDIRQRIIIFNNEFILEDRSDAQSNKNSKFQNQNDQINKEDEQEEIEVNLTLENGEIVNLKLNMDENIDSNIDNFCKENKISNKGKNLILKIVKSKIAELKGEKIENFDDNNNDNKNINYNKKINHNNKDINNINSHNNELNNN